MFEKSIVLCALVTVALAAVAEGPLFTKPEKFKDQPGCYIPDLDAVIPLSTRAPSKHQCMGIRCEESSIYYEYCSIMVLNDGLPSKLVEDSSKPYPDCCPKIVPEK